VKRRFRLTRSTDFKRVRRSGKSYAHPLIVLYQQATEQEGVRVGVAAGRTIGSAVQRNRAKRLLRAAMSNLISQVSPGVDLLLIARSPLATATLEQTRSALLSLLRRAQLLLPHDS
jgi:ribonuclease P protein component